MTHNKILKSISKIAPFLMVLLVVCSAGCITDMTVNFYVDDKLYYQMGVDGTNSLSFPPNPTKEGYSFAGWYFDKGVWDKQVTFTSLLDMPLAGEVAVYAYFTGEDVIEYKVTLDTNGGSFVNPPTILENGKIPVPDTPTRNHYTFMGWYTTPDCIDGTKWDFNSDVVTSDITLYAKWKAEASYKHYMDGYKQTLLTGVEGIVVNDDNVYITYYLAQVEGATISVLTDTVYNTGGQVLSVSSGSEIAKSTTKSIEMTITDSTGGSKTTSSEHSDYNEEYLSGLNVKFKFGPIELGGNIMNDKMRGNTTTTSSSTSMTWDTTSSISDSEDVTEDYVSSKEMGTTISLDPYPHDRYYRYVVKGSCIVTKTYVYNLKTQKIEISYYDSKIIDGTLFSRMEFCNDGEYFSIPSDGFNADMKNLDVSQLYKGSGTESDPFLISTVYELLLVPADITKHYRLANNIDMTGYEWFTYDLSAINFDYNGHSLLNTAKPGSAELPYNVASAMDFLNIYNDLDGHYKLVADIDLTGYTIPREAVFSGVLDGNGHTVIGHQTGNYLTVVDTTEFTETKYYGLFAKNSGTIKNLKLSKVKLLGEAPQHNGAWVYMGCVVGINTGTISNVELTNCEAQCHRSASSIGMVAGINEGQITDCKVKGGLLYGNGDGGGIAGTNTGTIASCSVSGNGVSGGIDNTFLHYYKVGSTEGVNAGNGRSWGGIVGYAPSTSVVKDVSVANIFVYCEFPQPGNTDNIGYVVGNNQGSISGSYSVHSVNNAWIGKKNVFNDLNYFKGKNGWTGSDSGTVPW